MYADFLQLLKQTYADDKVFDGEFGAMMDVSLVNDGPVTCAARTRAQHTNDLS